MSVKYILHPLIATQYHLVIDWYHVQTYWNANAYFTSYILDKAEVASPKLDPLTTSKELTEGQIRIKVYGPAYQNYYDIFKVFNVAANADVWMEVEGEFKELKFEGITGTLQVKRVDFPYVIQGTGTLTVPWIQNKQHAFLTKQDDDLYRLVEDPTKQSEEDDYTYFWFGYGSDTTGDSGIRNMKLWVSDTEYLHLQQYIYQGLTSLNHCIFQLFDSTETPNPPNCTANNRLMVDEPKEGQYLAEYWYQSVEGLPNLIYSNSYNDPYSNYYGIAVQRGHPESQRVMGVKIHNLDRPIIKVTGEVVYANLLDCFFEVKTKNLHYTSPKTKYLLGQFFECPLPSVGTSGIKYTDHFLIPPTIAYPPTEDNQLVNLGYVKDYPTVEKKVRRISGSILPDIKRTRITIYGESKNWFAIQKLSLYDDEGYVWTGLAQYNNKDFPVRPIVLKRYKPEDTPPSFDTYTNDYELKEGEIKAYLYYADYFGDMKMYSSTGTSEAFPFYGYPYTAQSNAPYGRFLRLRIDEDLFITKVTFTGWYSASTLSNMKVVTEISSTAPLEDEQDTDSNWTVSAVAISEEPIKGLGAFDIDPELSVIDVVKKTGSDTISGEKTFTVTPKLTSEVVEYKDIVNYQFVREYVSKIKKGIYKRLGVPLPKSITIATAGYSTWATIGKFKVYNDLGQRLQLVYRGSGSAASPKKSVFKWVDDAEYTAEYTTQDNTDYELKEGEFFVTESLCNALGKMKIHNTVAFQNIFTLDDEDYNGYIYNGDTGWNDVYKLEFEGEIDLSLVSITTYRYPVPQMRLTITDAEGSEAFKSEEMDDTSTITAEDF